MQNPLLLIKKIDPDIFIILVYYLLSDELGLVYIIKTIKIKK